MPTAEEQIRDLGIILPAMATPVANYVPFVRSGSLLFVAGQISRGPDGQPLAGKLGQTMNVDQGYQAAHAAARYVIAAMKTALGDLEKVVRIVRLFGTVNATPDFEAQPQVVNGASDLLVEVFGDRGRHARVAVGVSSLPLGAAVEIEVMAEVAD